MTLDRRVRTLKRGTEEAGPVVYWMSRDQRVDDNWALLFAQHLALRKQAPLMVAFCLVPSFLGATLRQYDFMLRGLQEVEEHLAEKDIPFCMLTGSPQQEVPQFVSRHAAGSLVTDFDPMRVKRRWKAGVADRVDIPFYEVDAHNIVPCWLASPKQEYAARTLRSKIERVLPEFLSDFPRLARHPTRTGTTGAANDWDTLRNTLRGLDPVPPVDWVEPGEESSRRALLDFVNTRLSQYAEARNDPNEDGQSNLSPYLHFGQLSAQRAALEVSKSGAGTESRKAFLEELVVRRELADNYCFYNLKYDSSDGFPDWARRTTDEHRDDRRQYAYSLQQFERAQTHDELWNAAQLEMVRRGKMHGYMRMYWAKKILEWTESPERALEIAIYLNDRYEMDGRDPSGYAGIAWSIGGVHDRPWPARPVFGKIRYMSYNGCRSKFDVDAYIEKHSTA
jgi:deoxyribodipyrimidine photo-lyase